MKDESLCSQIKGQMKLSKDMDRFDDPNFPKRNPRQPRMFSEMEIRRIVREEIVDFYNRLCQEVEHSSKSKKREHHAAEKAAAIAR